jgi:hypothetical protein
MGHRALLGGRSGGYRAPPGHSISIATQVLRRMDAGLDIAAETYAKVGMAVADAFVSCWDTKYRYNLLRPVTYIQKLIDADWKPLLTTPPFPEYVSGHSVQSGAAAEVLTDLFGRDHAFVDHTHESRGLPARAFSRSSRPPVRPPSRASTVASTSGQPSFAGSTRGGAWVAR